ncbi:MAG: hypothetical protein WCI91_01445 [Candidatus Nomurabacteria bacterium]
MINQQLLDYIKQQLLKGLNKETITKELLGGGWNEQDIQEGFNTVNASNMNSFATNSVISNSNLNQVVNHSNKKALLIIVVLFIIAAGGVSGFYYRNDLPIIKNFFKSKVIPVKELTQENNTKPQIQKVEPTVNKQETTTVVETNTTQNLQPKIEEIKTPTTSPVSSVAQNKVIPVVKNNIIDCGTTTIPGTNESDQKANDCMEKQFKSCSLSKENINILDPNTSPFAEGPKTYYKAYSEILGKRDKFCLVKIAYITSQRPEWNNKSMTCNYDNSKSYSDNNMYNSKCSGSLCDALNK